MKQITFGKRLGEVSKDKKMSQDDIAKKIDVHGAVIGRYERDKVKPAIDTVVAIADALGVSLDYLVGNTDLLLDSVIIKRIQDIQKMDIDTKGILFNVIDTYIQNFKTKKAFAH